MHDWYWGTRDSPDAKEGGTVSSVLGVICVLENMAPDTIFIEIGPVLGLLRAGLRKQICSLEEILGMNVRG